MALVLQIYQRRVLIMVPQFYLIMVPRLLYLGTSCNSYGTTIPIYGSIFNLSVTSLSYGTSLLN